MKANPVRKKKSTKQKKSPTSLKKSENNIPIVGNEASDAYIRNVFMQMPAVICILRGPDHVFDIANQQYMQLIGHRDIIGKPIKEALPELKGQGFYELLDGVYTTGKPFIGNEMPVGLDRGNGKVEECFFNFIYQPSYDKTGKIDGILVHGVEVTAQVIARKKTEESEEQFNTLANNIQNLAWIAEADGYIFWYNKRWYEYTGTTVEAMKGWGWQSVHDPEILPAVLEKWRGAINAGQPAEMTFPLKGADGIFRPFLTRVIPVHNNNGKVIRWVGTNTDISEQKKTEELLEKRVIERTEELEHANKELQQKNQEVANSNKNLEEKNKELENMNKEWETFTYISSHDLQEPLRKIRTFAVLLDEDKKNLSDKGKNYLHIIKKSVIRMQTLLKDLLDFSKVKSDGRNFEKTDFNKILQEVIDDLKETIQETKTTIKIAGHSEIKIIPVQFRQLLQNLIRNAIKFTHPEKHPHIVIKSEIKQGRKLNIDTLSPEINYCHFSVTDTGIGFDPHYKDRIFEVFQRLNEYEKYKGTGMGLAICKRVVENHYGVITATGELNKGARFDVYIPAD